MNSRNATKTWPLAVVVGLCSVWGCSSTTTTAPDTFIPNFTFVWQVQNDTSHTFTLLAPFGVASGTFDQGSNETFKGVSKPLQGTFNRHDLQFTTDRTVNGVKASFSGRFLDDDTISLQSPEGTLKVVRFKP